MPSSIDVIALYKPDYNTFMNIVRTNPIRRRALPKILAAGLCLLTTPDVLHSQTYRALPGVRIRAMAAGTANEVGDIAATVQLSAGTHVIADNVHNQLHFYSAAGRFIRTVGRRGAAAGEFQTVGWLGECGRDSVFAFDVMQNRISVFAFDGTFVRSFTPPASLVGFVRCTLDGAMLYVASGSTLGIIRRGAIQTSDNTGKLLYRSPELLLDEGRPLGNSIKVAIAPEGMVYGNGDSAFVMVMSIRGETPHRVPAGLANREPTEANRNAAIEYWATAVKGAEYDYDRKRVVIRKLQPVSTLPAYTDLFIDAGTKAMWVKTSTYGDPSTILERRGLDGAMLGTATLPPGLKIQQIRGDVVIATMTDLKSGEQMLVTYRLVK